MDIQKEREAFEKECRILCYNGNMVMSDLGSFYNNEQTNWMWQMWLSSKNQAIPDGFVVVPKKPTPKMIDATWDFDEEIQDMSHNSRNEFIYKSMIAAAEAESEQRGGQ